MRTWFAAACLVCCTACGGLVDPLDPGPAPSSSADAGVRDATTEAAFAGDAAVDVGQDAPALGLPGDPCAKAADCLSASSPLAKLSPTSCIAGDGASWPGGYCTDFCKLPPEPFAPPRLARANCPVGSVCLPRWSIQPSDVTQPEVGACLKECRIDSDCRASEGYYCRHDFWLGEPPVQTSFGNGYCAPLHCKSRGCNKSFVCGC
jgi:hypothetical protein